jgi:dTDP-4-amino-4,6-dideoxygalactose transaminase
MREIYKLYYYYLKDVVDIKRPLDEKEWIPWFVDIFTEKRQGLSEFLKKHKVFTRFVYQEISKSKIYYSDKYFENTHYCCNNGLFLPSHIMLSDSDIEYICKLIIFYFNK